jgi:hypothetical protein
MAAGAAVAAAMLGMGTAHADVDVAPSGYQGFSTLFGGDGTDSGVTTS